MPKLKDIIEGLISTYGLRPSISSREYECMRYNYLLKEYGQCVGRIRKMFNLTMIKIHILYVNNEEMLASLSDREKRTMELYANRSASSSLNMKEGAALMRIRTPVHMPLYGTKEFQGLPLVLSINIEHIDKSFDSFLVNVAHEMSHIILYSTLNRWKHSEKATDILLMLQGFSEVNERVYAGGIRSYLTPAEVKGICDYIRKRRLK